MGSSNTPDAHPELSAAERDELLRAVMKWNEYGATFYVDHYVAPAVEKILRQRAALSASHLPACSPLITDS